MALSTVLFHIVPRFFELTHWSEREVQRLEQ